MQTFSSSLSTQLHNLNGKLADYQSTYANMKSQTTSLISLQNLLRNDLELFHSVKSIVTTSNTSNTLLTNLHDLACQSHSIGEHTLHTFVLKLLLPSLETYLRPLHGWMTQGHLATSTSPDFFITSSLQNGHYVYDLVRENGAALAPRFMLHLVNRVLAAGKTMAFVKQVNTPQISHNHESEPFKFESTTLNPFDEAFESALNEWVMKKYEFTSTMLRKTLEESKELGTQLDAIHGIYCMLSHECMTQFTETLFNKVRTFLKKRIYINHVVDEFTRRMARSSCSYE
jgi:hypothetical protein